jgi:hypothetical protein
MIELQSVSLLDLEGRQGKKTFTKDDFLDCQVAKRGEATKHFESVFERVQSIVQHVCENVANLGEVQEDGEDGEGMWKQVEKNKSMVAIKAEQANRKRILKRASQENAMLADFIRAVDYLVVECLTEKVRTDEMKYESQLISTHLNSSYIIH